MSLINRIILCQNQRWEISSTVLNTIPKDNGSAAEGEHRKQVKGDRENPKAQDVCAQDDSGQTGYDDYQGPISEPYTFKVLRCEGGSREGPAPFNYYFSLVGLGNVSL